jgi:hypothetical protein
LSHHNAEKITALLTSHGFSHVHILQKEETAQLMSQPRKDSLQVSQNVTIGAGII